MAGDFLYSSSESQYLHWEV